ncbi:MAG: hypothetical protein QOI01_5660 [Mycobacterium sp.]|nr:hypothetical protein [Mycobacterium sp.]
MRKLRAQLPCGPTGERPHHLHWCIRPADPHQHTPYGVQRNRRSDTLRTLKNKTDTTHEHPPVTNPDPPNDSNRRSPQAALMASGVANVCDESAHVHRGPARVYRRACSHDQTAPRASSAEPPDSKPLRRRR